jgi:hypothetical protein
MEKDKDIEFWKLQISKIKKEYGNDSIYLGIALKELRKAIKSHFKN